MALTPGTKLGPYEIAAPLGAGGMGEVYRAQDTRLGRKVAIKVLPSHLSSNADLKARFEREARTISSLNHAHICQLYDVGLHGETDYLVMEFLEGETLEHRLQKGPLPLKQAVELGIQIAEALEKAHHSGIVHRDLKPGNVMLTASGAKLMDFGLAKPASAIAAGGLTTAGPLTPSTPTLTLAALSTPVEGLTQSGSVVGTLQYMAPEVLRGQEADARSDIFSLGCVLYEMVTGRRAFEGKSQLSVMTAILEKDPEPIGALHPDIPAGLDYTVQNCLEKNPDERLQTAHDVKLQLAWVAKTGPQAAPAASARRLWRSALLAAIAGALLVAAAAIVAWRWRDAEPRPVIRMTMLPPTGMAFHTLYRNGAPALSPDGTKVVFVAGQEEKTSLWIRPLDRLEATELQGTEGAYFPFWSPDGRSLAFFANGKLWRMDVNSGSTTAICDAPEARGGSWGSSNVILLAPVTTGPIMRVPAAGGTPTPVTSTRASAGGASDRWPFFLPDGKHFLYLYSLVGAADDRNEIHFASIDGGNNQVLLKGRYTVPRYASGWLLVGLGETVMARKFDPSTGAFLSDTVQTADKVVMDGVVASSVFSASQQGIFLYQHGTGTSGEHHVFVDMTGKQIAQLSDPALYGSLRISPDSSKIAMSMVGQTGSTDIWMWDLKRGTRARLSRGALFADTPVWSPDGRTIYFVLGADKGPIGLYATPADGSRPPQVVVAAPTDVSVADASGDGKWLLYEESMRDNPQYSTLKALPLAAEAKAFVVLERIDSSSNARLMPGLNDWVAFQASDSGRSEVYVTRFPNAGAKYQVSFAGGTQPVWSRDGKRLYYLDVGQRLTAVDIKTDKDSIEFGTPKTLFQTSVRTSITSEGYDVTADGRFLLMNMITENPTPLTLIVNWDTEIRK